MDISSEIKLTAQSAKERFPNLDLNGFDITSEIDVFYNCFAWAAGDTERNWQPSRSSIYTWFTASLAETVENYIENYGYVGFEVTASGDYDPAFEKIALYVNQDGEPLHAARQLDNGSWTSKLSWKEDVEHQTLECLEGNEFGKVSVILQRAKGDPEQWIKTAIQTRQKSSKTSKS